jgi:single-strand DNA-binding protein
MNGLNKVILLGTLGQDPKPHTSREGKSYTTLNLATNRSWKNNDGKYEKKTDWHQVHVWGKQGLVCQENLKKGNSVAIEGYISTISSEEDGKRRWSTFITANDVNFISNKNDSSTH